MSPADDAWKISGRARFVIKLDGVHGVGKVFMLTIRFGSMMVLPLIPVSFLHSLMKPALVSIILSNVMAKLLLMKLRLEILC
jgi:hypothetical protein